MVDAVPEPTYEEKMRRVQCIFLKTIVAYMSVTS